MTYDPNVVFSSTADKPRHLQYKAGQGTALDKDTTVYQSQSCLCLNKCTQANVMITQLIISTHLDISAAIGGHLQELNCHCSLSSEQ